MSTSTLTVEERVERVMENEVIQVQLLGWYGEVNDWSSRTKQGSPCFQALVFRRIILHSFLQPNHTFAETEGGSEAQPASSGVRRRSWCNTE